MALYRGVGTTDTLGDLYSVSYETFEAFEGQTEFAFTSATYTRNDNTLDVYVNGIKQLVGASEAYTEESPSMIKFTEGLNEGDVVEMRALIFV